MFINLIDSPINIGYNFIKVKIKKMYYQEGMNIKYEEKRDLVVE